MKHPDLLLILSFDCGHIGEGALFSILSPQRSSRSTSVVWYRRVSATSITTSIWSVANTLVRPPPAPNSPFSCPIRSSRVPALWCGTVLQGRALFWSQRRRMAAIALARISMCACWRGLKRGKRPSLCEAISSSTDCDSPNSCAPISPRCRCVWTGCSHFLKEFRIESMEFYAIRPMEFALGLVRRAGRETEGV